MRLIRNFATISQTRFNQHRVESLSIVEKYAAKLKEKAKQEGVASIEELKLKLANKINQERTKPITTKSIFKSQISSNNALSQTSSKIKESPASFGSLKKYTFKTLFDIMDMNKAKSLCTKEISNLWLSFNSQKGNLSATIPSETYKELYTQSKKYPIFILPVEHETTTIGESNSTEFYYLQWTHHTLETAPHSLTTHVLFTSLGEYKLRGEFAIPKLTITHHADLIDQGHVLMQGEIQITEKGLKSLNDNQAQWLLFLLQQFYLTGNEKKRAMLEAFHQNPEKFDYTEFLKEAKNIKLPTK